MDLSRITTFCFVASYAVALSLEVFGLAGRLRGRMGEFVGSSRRLAAISFAAAGLFAHSAFLTIQARDQATPLSSAADWYLIAALLLALVYLLATLASPRWALGVFLLPIVLILVGVSHTASTEPFAPERASLFWGQLHGWLLILATVTVCIGFTAGLMYLVQSWRLKQKLPPKLGFGLPSLEWLEKTNARALATSVWLVAGGFISGLVLSILKNREVDEYRLWADPVVLSLTAMLVWLIVAEVFRIVYPPARRGRKVAYLTVASFLFLVITLTSLTVVGSVHGTSPKEKAAISANVQQVIALKTPHAP